MHPGPSTRSATGRLIVRRLQLGWANPTKWPTTWQVIFLRKPPLPNYLTRPQKAHQAPAGSTSPAWPGSPKWQLHMFYCLQHHFLINPISLQRAHQAPVGSTSPAWQLNSPTPNLTNITHMPTSTHAHTNIYIQYTSHVKPIRPGHLMLPHISLAPKRTFSQNLRLL